MLQAQYRPTLGYETIGYDRVPLTSRQIGQWHRGGCGRANSNAPGTANGIASAKSSPVVKSSALARSTNSREMVIVIFA